VSAKPSNGARRVRPLRKIVAGVLTGFALTAIAAVGPATAADQQRPRAAEACMSPTIKPSRLFLTCGVRDFVAYSTGEWVHWGRYQAREVGHLEVSNCKPTCAETQRYGVVVVLTRPRTGRCEGVDAPVFTRARVELSQPNSGLTEALGLPSVDLPCPVP
jgi:hypothetical protein